MKHSTNALPSELAALALARSSDDPDLLGKFAVNLIRPDNPEMVAIISVPAIKVFTALLGKWQSHGIVIMNANPTPVIATSPPPANVPMPQEPMPLTSDVPSGTPG